MQTPFFVDPYLTSIAVAYRNGLMIADSVMPRIPVLREVFRYYKYEKADKFTVPDTKVGRKGQTHEIEFGSTETTGQVVSYGLEDPIPNDDLVNAAGSPVDPLGQSAENLTDLIELDREVRVAAVVFNAANYATANKETLAGSTQWSHADSNPVNAILAALDAMIFRANKMVLGRAVFTRLIQHPKVVAAALPLGGNAATGGKVTRQALADLFELQEVLVGEGWVNSNKRGKEASLARVWGDSCALLFVDGNANTGNGRVTFGYTAQWQQRVAGQFQDTNIGLRGGVRVRVGESVKEVITANDLGYLFSDCLA